ncbi:hypothetical protein AB3R30_17650 [Leptolyngbyaceae cyanobacterium UHCC 1019]
MGNHHNKGVRRSHSKESAIANASRLNHPLHLTSLEAIMSMPKLIDNIIQYFSAAISRIFGPDDNSYPETGVQPFDGEVNKKSHLSD